MGGRLSLGGVASSVVLAAVLVFAGAGVAGAVPSAKAFVNGNPHFGDRNSSGYVGQGEYLPPPLAGQWEGDGEKWEEDGEKPQFLVAGYNGNGGYHALGVNSDNHENQVHSVAEPATVLLLGSGLVGLFYMRRKPVEG